MVAGHDGVPIEGLLTVPVPIPTTVIAVYAMVEAEPGEGRTRSLRASVPGHVSAPRGSEAQAPGGGAETVDAVILCDPVDGMAHTDQCETSEGDVYEVVWVRRRVGLGLDHMQAGCRRITGTVA